MISRPPNATNALELGVSRSMRNIIQRLHDLVMNWLQILLNVKLWWVNVISSLRKIIFIWDNTARNSWSSCVARGKFLRNFQRQHHIRVHYIFSDVLTKHMQIRARITQIWNGKSVRGNLPHVMTAIRTETRTSAEKITQFQRMHLHVTKRELLHRQNQLLRKQRVQGVFGVFDQSISYDMHSKHLRPSDVRSKLDPFVCTSTPTSPTREQTRGVRWRWRRTCTHRASPRHLTYGDPAPPAARPSGKSRPGAE